MAFRLGGLLLVALIATACAGEPIAGLPRSQDALRWDFGDDTPEDLRDLAAEVLDRFSESFPARGSCAGAVGLTGARELDDRARYAPDVQTITIRIPATAGQLRISLIHELAHHLEFNCPDHRDLRRPFLRAQGLAPDTGWSTGPTWEETPSEQWATAVVEVVTGRPDPRAPTLVRPAALDVVRDWAG